MYKRKRSIRAEIDNRRYIHEYNGLTVLDSAGNREKQFIPQIIREFNDSPL